MSLTSTITGSNKRDSLGRFVTTVQDSYCKDCGKKINKYSTRCVKCSNKIHRENGSLKFFSKGYKPWNKGKKGLFKMPRDAVEKIRQHNIGRPLTQEHKDKISMSNKGKKHPNRTGNYKHTEEHKMRFKESAKNSIKFRQAITNRLKTKGMSKLEKRAEEIINRLNLPYVYCGDGGLVINGKYPDFVHKTKKILIEVFYVSHKINMGQAKQIGIEEWIKQRRALFEKDGWATIFFNEKEVNDKKMTEVLDEFK